MLIESNKVELKSKYTDQIVKEIVSFLNSDGGKIYIGVNDDGTVCGASEILCVDRQSIHADDHCTDSFQY